MPSGSIIRSVWWSLGHNLLSQKCCGRIHKGPEGFGRPSMESRRWHSSCSCLKAFAMSSRRFQRCSLAGSRRSRKRVSGSNLLLNSGRRQFSINSAKRMQRTSEPPGRAKVSPMARCCRLKICRSPPLESPLRSISGKVLNVWLTACIFWKKASLSACSSIARNATVPAGWTASGENKLRLVAG
jgi:hypothetical protein